MSSPGKKCLLDAVRVSARSNEILKETYTVILDSVGSARNYDENSFLAQSLSTISECAEKMGVVSKSLAEISERSKPAFPLLQGKAVADRDNDAPYIPFEDRYLRKAVNQSKHAFAILAEVYDLVLDSLGSAGSRGDNELLYQNLKIIEDCKEKLHLISTSIAAINESVEQCELEVLYGPPPFFEND